MVEKTIKHDQQQRLYDTPKYNRGNPLLIHNHKVKKIICLWWVKGKDFNTNKDHL